MFCVPTSNLIFAVASSLTNKARNASSIAGPMVSARYGGAQIDILMVCALGRFVAVGTDCDKTVISGVGGVMIWVTPDFGTFTNAMLYGVGVAGAVQLEANAHRIRAG